MRVGIISSGVVTSAKTATDTRPGRIPLHDIIVCSAAAAEYTRLRVVDFHIRFGDAAIAKPKINDIDVVVGSHCGACHVESSFAIESVRGNYRCPAAIPVAGRNGNSVIGCPSIAILRPRSSVSMYIKGE